MKLYAVAAIALAALLCGCSGDEPAAQAGPVLKARKAHKAHKARRASRGRLAMEESGW